MAARVLLKADERNEQRLSSSQIAQALDISPRTVIRIKQRFVQQGLAAALTGNSPKERPLRRKVDGRVEAHLIVLACGPAPQGQRHWTMQLLADRVVDLGIVDQITDETVRLALKKMNCGPGSSVNGVFLAREPTLSGTWKTCSMSIAARTRSTNR